MPWSASRIGSKMIELGPSVSPRTSDVWNAGDVEACRRYLAPTYTIWHDPGDPWEGRTLDCGGFEDRLFADASAVISIKNYKSVDLGARWLKTWNDRVELWTHYRYQSFPEEDFFGIGPGAITEARTNYKIAGNDITSRGLIHLRPWLTMGADLGYDSPKVGYGLDAGVPSIERVFTGCTTCE